MVMRLRKVVILFSPVLSRHDSAHEFIEERNRKSRITVIGTPHHSLCDQVVSCRPQRSHFAFQFVSDVTRTVRAGAEFGHCPQVFFLSRCESIESDTEKTFIKCCNRGLRASFNIFAGDWRFIGRVPRMFAPLLQEIRISLSLLQDQFQRIVVDRNAFSGCRFGDRDSCCYWSQRPNFRKVKKSLRVGLGFSHPPPKLRQTSAD